MQFTQCESVALYGMSMHAVTALTVSLYQLRLKPQVFCLLWIQKQPVIQQSVRHTDEAK